MDQYPTIKLIVERGGLIAAAIAILPLLGGAVLLLLGVHWFALAAGAVAAGVAYFLMKSYVELVRVIADMLLPK
jgi:4-hydroxybenzoate polyprenyltransferase